MVGAGKGTQTRADRARVEAVRQHRGDGAAHVLGMHTVALRAGTHQLARVPHPIVRRRPRSRPRRRAHPSPGGWGSPTRHTADRLLRRELVEQRVRHPQHRLRRPLEDLGLRRDDALDRTDAFEVHRADRADDGDVGHDPFRERTDLARPVHAHLGDEHLAPGVMWSLIVRESPPVLLNEAGDTTTDTSRATSRRCAAWSTSCPNCR